jgi:hypothetical protein
MAAKYKITILQGETFDKTIVWKSGDPSNLVNLTGYTARMQIRKKYGDAVVLLSLTTENGKIILGGTAGTIQLLLSATDTSAIDWVAGVYDLELVSSGGVVKRLLYGTVKVSLEVTI